ASPLFDDRKIFRIRALVRSLPDLGCGSAIFFLLSNYHKTLWWDKRNQCLYAWQIPLKYLPKFQAFKFFVYGFLISS
ncbi:MAG: hypothetical protein KAW88_08400, partial [Candidatus Cloacimonetes bacterium]|nr:hypothetical protein [Candidatus Cloacimonadota bacterium]